MVKKCYIVQGYRGGRWQTMTSRLSKAMAENLATQRRALGIYRVRKVCR